jgi:hypothetical protein
MIFDAFRVSDALLVLSLLQLFVYKRWTLSLGVPRKISPNNLILQSFVNYILQRLAFSLYLS